MNEDLLKLHELGGRIFLKCYKARWHGNDVLVEEGEAKQIHPLLRNWEQKLAQWRSLSHPNLMRLLAVEEKDWRIYFIYEWKEGSSLASVMKGNQPLEATQALSLATQMAEVMNYLHEKGVVHGFLSPNSFQVRPDGAEIYLMDWVGETLVKKGILAMGGNLPDRCYHYSAPEVYSGREPLPLSDWFSLGCLFFQLLTGVHPYSDRFGRPSLEAILQGNLLAQDLLEELPGGLRFILQPLLSAEISHRNVHPLEWIGSARALQAEFASRKKRVITRKSPLWRFASALILFLMIGFSAFFLLRFLLFFFPQFTRGLVVTPDLTGLDEVSARGKLAPLQLILEIEQEEFHNEVPKGKIIRQDPPPGKRIPKNSSISVVLSKGRSLTRMPQVTDLDLEEARKKLESLGLKVQIRYAISDMPKDWVIHQYPPPGAEIRVDSQVMLTVSTGGEQILIPVPDVVGMNMEDAIEKLTSSGLEPRDILIIHRKNIEGDRVIQQNPPKDTLSPFGSDVSLTVERSLKLWGSFTLSLSFPTSTEPKRFILYLQELGIEQVLEDRKIKGPLTLIKQISFQSEATLRAEWDMKILRKITFTRKSEDSER
ncbi:MAG: PASTA domain-containing protein [bacterium JZ-2024 1]